MMPANSHSCIPLHQVPGLVIVISVKPNREVSIPSSQEGESLEIHARIAHFILFAD